MEIKSQQMTVLLLSMFIFTLGFGITVPVMPYFARDLGGTVIDVGLLMGVFSAMELIFAPIWGKVSDRFGRKPVLLLGLVGFAIGFAASGLSTELWMLYASQAFAGLMMAGVFPATMSYIADNTEPGDRARQMGLLGAANGLGVIFGPALASLFAIRGLEVPFFAAAVLAVVTTAITLLWLTEHRDEVPVLTVKKSGNKASWLQPQLLIFFLVMLFVMVAMASLEATFGYFAMDRFGLSEMPAPMPVLWGTIMLTGTNVMGIAFTFFGLMGAITQAALVDKVLKCIGETRTIIAGLVALAAGTFLLILAGELITAITAASIMAIGMGLLMPSINSAVSSRTDRDSQGVVMGILGSFNSAGRVIGPVAGGLAYSISMLLPYVASAILALASAGFLAVWGKLSGKDKSTRAKQPNS